MPFNDNGIPPRLASLLAREPEVKMSQFRLGSDPFWAWVCAVLDPQDAIKELMNCILRAARDKSGGPIWIAVH